MSGKDIQQNKNNEQENNSYLQSGKEFPFLQINKFNFFEAINNSSFQIYNKSQCIQINQQTSK